MKFIEKHKLAIIIAVIVGLLGLIIWLAIDSGRRSATIVFEYTPSVAELYANDKKVENEAKVEPGTYTISVRQDGFESYEEEFTISKDETRTVYAVLESNDPSTANWYAEHPGDEQNRQRIYDNRITAETDAINQNFPIGAILPYVDPRGAFRIDYGAGERPNSQAVYIRYFTDMGKTLAESYISDNDFELADYEVKYIQEDFSAPPIEEDNTDFGADDEPRP